MCLHVASICFVALVLQPIGTYHQFGFVIQKKLSGKSSQSSNFKPRETANISYPKFSLGNWMFFHWGYINYLLLQTGDRSFAVGMLGKHHNFLKDLQNELWGAFDSNMTHSDTYTHMCVFVCVCIKYCKITENIFLTVWLKTCEPSTFTCGFATIALHSTVLLGRRHQGPRFHEF